MQQEPLTMSVREACHWLGVGRDEGYRMVADGRLPALRVGPRIRIPRAAVVRLIEALCAEQRLPGDGSPRADGMTGEAPPATGASAWRRGPTRQQRRVVPGGGSAR